MLSKWLADSPTLANLFTSKEVYLPTSDLRTGKKVLFSSSAFGITKGQFILQVNGYVGFQHFDVLELILQALPMAPAIGRIQGKQLETEMKLKASDDIWILRHQSSTHTF